MGDMPERVRLIRDAQGFISTELVHMPRGASTEYVRWDMARAGQHAVNRVVETLCNGKMRPEERIEAALNILEKG